MSARREKIRFSTGIHILGPCADRFVSSGYKDEKDIADMIQAVGQIEELDGVELILGVHVSTSTVDKVKKMLEDAGLQVSLVLPDLFVDRKWSKGSFTSTNETTRKTAIGEVKESMDIAAHLGCSLVNVWCGHDGFDYSFQANYDLAWDQLVQGVRECCDYRRDVKVAVEYKIKEPRTHLFIGTVGKCLLLLDAVKRENTGVVLDIGHALFAYENPAESAVLLDKFGNKLSHLHLNDNYRYWDDDMMPGSVHTVEYLELLYWLNHIGYNGWYSLDIFPYRENGIEAARESIHFMKTLLLAVDKVSPERIQEVVMKGDAVEGMKLVEEMLS